MGKPYETELAQLRPTLHWAAQRDIARLEQALRDAARNPLVAVGSGGSFSLAELIAGCHRRMLRRTALAMTPLAACQSGQDMQAAYWLLSAGGNNSDILAAFDTLNTREPAQLFVLGGSARSKLASRALQYQTPAFTGFDYPWGGDGFLATNSLAAFSVLALRAYGKLTGASLALTEVFEALDRVNALMTLHADALHKLLARRATVLLHSDSTTAGAVDMASRFTEAALGHVMPADFRNFAHGRHVWLSKHAQDSGVIVFLSDEDTALADATLACLPDELPRVVFRFGGRYESIALQAMLTSIYIAGIAGKVRGIDPGRPGVAAFGERLYELKPPVMESQNAGPDLLEPAIRRKAARLPCTSGPSETLLHSPAQYLAKLRAAQFAAVVFDYDGTLVSGIDRFRGPTELIVSELVRLLSGGVRLGIATGRGKSVREDLLKALPTQYADHVVVAYYNGGQIGRLSDRTVPDQAARPTPAIEAMSTRLREVFGQGIECELRATQISVQCATGVIGFDLWRAVSEVVMRYGEGRFRVVESSHSVDVIPYEVSKSDLLRHFEAQLGIAPEQILCIGDRGEWPGNDFDMLASAWSLSVERVCAETDRCWNFAPAGMKNTAATAFYLSRLPVAGGVARVTL